jgi:hypothetical protein
MLVRKSLLFAIVLAVWALPAAAFDAPKVQVVPLSHDGEIFVSFQFAEALTDEIRTATCAAAQASGSIERLTRTRSPRQ